MGGTDIALKKEMKILDSIIHEKLIFNAHVDITYKKVVGIYKQLIRAAGTSWGLYPEIIHQIYIVVMEPIVLYAASVQKRLNFIQRSFTQKFCMAYRTVSLQPLGLDPVRDPALDIQSSHAIQSQERGSLPGRSGKRDRATGLRA